MVETLLAMFVLFLILFGMLQVCYLFTGQFFLDYAALRGARSCAVGFRDYLVTREVRVNAIGGSGRLTEPAPSPMTGRYAVPRFNKEKTLIQRYLVGARWLEYEYWFGSTALELERGADGGNRFARVGARFRGYLFPEYISRKWFFKEGIDLTGEGAVANYAAVYLEE